MIRSMSSNKSKSAAPAERERLLPPALVLTFTAMVGVGLALMFPRETLRERLLGQGRTVDGLTVAYLEAWSRVAPNDTSFMGVLAEQYARSGRLDDAEAMLARMQAVQGADLSGPILRTRIEISQQRAYAALPETPERARRLATMNDLLKDATTPAQMRKWSLADLQALATQSRQIGAADPAGKLFRELAVRDPGNADFYNKQLAGIALAGGNYRDSAQALFDAQARAKNLYEQRTLFLQALQTLQSGNLLDEALAEAERRGGKLLDDAEVLRYLTKLALAAGKPEVAAKYVERLLKLSANKPMGATLLAQAHLRRVSDTEPWLAREVVFLDGPRGVKLRDKLAAAGELGVRHVADTGNVSQADAQAAAKAEVAAAAAEGKAFNADDYDLAYRVFLAAGKLDQAQRVAQAAVQKLPNEPVWRERLAQVAEWNRQPMIALQSWLQYAQATNDERAWNNVMRLAPGLSDDRAYLAALDEILTPLLDRMHPDIVFYNAGVDPHADDRLGRLSLSDAGLAERDRVVIEAVRGRGIPLAGVIGGGYGADVEPIARRHALLHHAAAAFAG